MKHLRKIGLFVVLSVVTVGATLLAAENIMNSDGGMGGITSALEAMKLKRLKPGMPPEEVKRQSALAPKGIMGLLKGLTNPNSLTADQLDLQHSGSGSKSSAATTAKDVHISVRENRDAILQRQTDPTYADASGVKGVVADAEKRHQIQVSQTADGREAVAVISDPSVHDLSDVDRIMNMNISEDLRAKILKNYEETGILPEILVREKAKRDPSTSTNGGGEADNPYNKNNW